MIKYLHEFTTSEDKHIAFPGFPSVLTQTVHFKEALL